MLDKVKGSCHTFLDKLLTLSTNKVFNLGLTDCNFYDKLSYVPAKGNRYHLM